MGEQAWVEEILRIYDQHSDGDTLEVEVRFGSYERVRNGGRTFDKFNGSVPKSAFESLFENLSQTFASEAPLFTREVIYNIEGVSFRSIDRHDGIFIYQSKQRVLNPLDAVEHGLRVTFKREIDLSESQFNQETRASQPSLIREKTRHSFNVVSGLRLDLTEVQEISGGVQSDVKYEVELEIVERSGFEALHETVHRQILSIIQLSDIVYTTSFKRDVVQFFNRIRGTDTDYANDVNQIARSIFVDPVPLEFGDLSLGGLFDKNERSRFVVSKKADGYYSPLFCKDGFVGFVNRSGSEMNIVYQSDQLRGIDFILEGELIPVERRRDVDSIYYYSVYNCLHLGTISKLWSRKYVGSSQNDPGRYEIASSLVEILKGIEGFPVKIFMKEIRKFDKIDQFFTVHQGFIEQEEEFDVDGLIYTSINEYYGERTVLKWKEVVTIDFRVVEQGGRFFLYYADNILFVGSDMKEFKQENIEISQEIRGALYEGAIVEFKPEKIERPGGDSSEDNYEIKLIAVGIRYDKTDPNGFRTVMSNWKEIIDPITRETLQGRGLRLVFKYHNRIKKELWSSAKSKYTGRPRAVNLGSGYGGDDSKVLEYGSILNVEPDAKHIQIHEGRRAKFVASNNRLPQHKRKILPDIKIIQAGGEETEKILRAAVEHFKTPHVDVIAMMLSLTFFFSRNGVLDQLIQTIDRLSRVGTRFIFLAMDGTVTEQLFKDAPRDESGYRHKTIGGADMRLGPDNLTLEIRIEGTIVGGVEGEYQTEWLTNLQLLERKLATIGYSVEGTLKRANSEAFLSSEAKQFSSLYTYGTFVKTREIPKQNQAIQKPTLPVGLVAVETTSSIQSQLPKQVLSPNTLPMTSGLPIQKPIQIGQTAGITIGLQNLNLQQSQQVQGPVMGNKPAGLPLPSNSGLIIPGQLPNQVPQIGQITVGSLPQVDLFKPQVSQIGQTVGVPSLKIPVHTQAPTPAPSAQVLSNGKPLIGQTLPLPVQPIAGQQVLNNPSIQLPQPVTGLPGQLPQPAIGSSTQPFKISPIQSTVQLPLPSVSGVPSLVQATKTSSLPFGPVQTKQVISPTMSTNLPFSVTQPGFIKPGTVLSPSLNTVKQDLSPNLIGLPLSKPSISSQPISQPPIGGIKINVPNQQQPVSVPTFRPGQIIIPGQTIPVVQSISPPIAPLGGATGIAPLVPQPLSNSSIRLPGQPIAPLSARPLSIPSLVPGQPSLQTSGAPQILPLVPGQRLSLPAPSTILSASSNSVATFNIPQMMSALPQQQLPGFGNTLSAPSFMKSFGLDVNVALADDDTRSERYSGYQNIVRIGCIADGSCFFHALSKAAVEIYNQMDYVGRVAYVARLRDSIANKLYQVDQNGVQFYFTLGVSELGQIEVRQFDEQGRSVGNRITDSSDYSIDGFARRVRSSSVYADESFFELASIIFDVSFIVTQRRDNDLKKITSVIRTGRDFVILFNMDDYHYELIGLEIVETNNGVNRTIQTKFRPDHPLITALLSQN